MELYFWRSLRFILNVTDRCCICLADVVLQVAASSNAIFLKDRDSENQNQIHLNISTMAVGEKEPLMYQQGTQYLS